MSTFGLKPLLHPPLQIQIMSPLLFFPQRSQPFAAFRRGGRLCFSSSLRAIRAERESDSKTAAEADPHVLFEETYRLKRIQLVEGKVTARLDWGEERMDVGGFNGRLVVGTDLEGSWVLHWGVTYFGDDFRSEWDQPPAEMRPPSSVTIKDYAIETPLDKSLSTLEGQILHQVKIDLDSRFSIEAIHFVLKNEETGAWFQHRGRDFKIPLLNFPQEDVTVCKSQNFSIWPGETKDKRLDILQVKGFYEEYPITKEEPVENSLTVSVSRDYKMDKNHLHFDTDIPCQVVVHWGVCKNSNTMWEFPASPHPAESTVFRKKAIQTTLQKKKNSVGSWGLFPLDKDIFGVLFVLKLNDNSWLKNAGDDFYVCLKNEGILNSNTSIDQIKVKPVERVISMLHDGTTSTENKITKGPKSDIEKVQEAEYTNEIINDIRNLVTDISSEKRKITKSKNVQENILQEIENLAAEAYSIFRSSIPNFVYEPSFDSESLKPPVQVSSGIGSGYEVLCQGFNWETHKSGRWYSDLTLKAAELSKIGFTTIWLPPPTESVSPEGYMPKDLYNLNSRYGNIEELKVLVKTLHQVGIKVLGDVVLNHRCAHTKNQDGIWNIFGGRLNWDDRAIVSDDPHFQGRGNRSSGDHFHAAPNIDHSQDFVRKDIKDWLCWLRDEIGYDGWRLDFVRGFWGGYVKDYLEASRPFFAVGEYWDSLSYTYGQMDHNQDAHRQRIVDWINATNGSAGAFDVTTKGILHTAIERCEYWRLSDEKGKPPGVVGWWPSRAVTFIENHDTGSTQGHWRFPKGNEMQGYAYILTHPGTPTVFYDHIYSHYQQEIANLISLRSRLKLHCRSKIKITKVERDVYAAVLDEKVAMKIGPGHYEPPHDEGSSNNSWIVSAEGKNYKVWESIIDYKV